MLKRFNILSPMNDKIKIIRLVLVAFLLFVGNSTESVGISNTFLFISYFITAFEALYKGFIAINNNRYFSEDVLFLLISLFSLVLGINHAALIINMYYYFYYIEELIIKQRQEFIMQRSDSNIEHVNIINGVGSVSVTSPEHIKKGDLIIVNPGERVLTDGIVADGISFVNTDAVTHDNNTVEVSINDRVMAGYINLTAPFTYKSKTTIYNTHFNDEKKIGRFAVGSNVFLFVRKYTNLASRIAIIFTVLYFVISLFTSYDYDSVVALLIVSGMFSFKLLQKYIFSESIFNAIKNGILFKSSDSIIKVSESSTVIVEFKDKIGDYIIDSVDIYDDFTEENIKAFASCLYSKSKLPFAEAICKYANTSSHNLKISGYREIDHSGCFAYVSGHQIVSGTTDFMNKQKIHIPLSVNNDFSGVHFAVDGSYVGNIAFQPNDFYKLSNAMAEMKNSGVKHFVIFGVEDADGAARIRNVLKADYFSINDDRTRIINDIIDNVPGKVTVFGWHDWLVSGVNSVYLGSNRIHDKYIDSDIAVAGSSVSLSSFIFKLSTSAKKLTAFSFWLLMAFKAVILLLALVKFLTPYTVLIGEFVIFIAISLIVSFSFKNNQ